MQTASKQGLFGKAMDKTTDSMMGDAIKTGDKVQLMNHSTHHFVGAPVLSLDNWDNGIGSDTPSAHTLIPVTKSTGTICYGDQVRIRTLNAHNGKFDFMYSSPLGRIWYDQLAENSKQFWIIKKDGIIATSEIRSGDLVYFENVGYPGSRLFEKDGQLCCGVSDHVWEIKNLQ
jgi:hypothetical protein